MIALYSLALLVSAALLFPLEPMVAKFVLPLLGSAPEVCPTTVLFFQAALLAGYGFAHATSRLSPRRRTARVQREIVMSPCGMTRHVHRSGDARRARRQRALAPIDPVRDGCASGQSAVLG